MNLSRLLKELNFEQVNPTKYDLLTDNVPFIDLLVAQSGPNAPPHIFDEFVWL